LTGQDAGERERPEGRPLGREEELTQPMALFLAHVLVPFTSYAPDLAALASRLTLAAGSDSRGQLLHRTAEFLGQRTGSPFVEFPGGHIGAIEHPAAFAERLTKTLLAADAP
jgi:pimeloyl-ACP methyl ester carboxylesterase